MCGREYAVFCPIVPRGKDGNRAQPTGTVDKEKLIKRLFPGPNFVLVYFMVLKRTVS
jgi:hypothetical protein